MNKEEIQQSQYSVDLLEEFAKKLFSDQKITEWQKDAIENIVLGLRSIPRIYRGFIDSNPEMNDSDRLQAYMTGGDIHNKLVLEERRGKEVAVDRFRISLFEENPKEINGNVIKILVKIISLFNKEKRGKEEFIKYMNRISSGELSSKDGSIKKFIIPINKVKLDGIELGVRTSYKEDEGGAKYFSKAEVWIDIDFETMGKWLESRKTKPKSS